MREDSAHDESTNNRALRRRASRRAAKRAPDRTGRNPVGIQPPRNRTTRAEYTTTRSKTLPVGKLKQASSTSGLEIHQQAQQHDDPESDNGAAINDDRRIAATTVTTTTTIVHDEQDEPSTSSSPAHEIQDLLEQDRELELERLHSLQETMEQEKTELQEQQQFVEAAVKDMQAELELISDPVVAQLDPERCARSREAIAHQIYNNTLGEERTDLEKDIRIIDEATLELEHEIDRVTGTRSSETDAVEHGYAADGNGDRDDPPDPYTADSEYDNTQAPHGQDGDLSSSDMYANDEDHMEPSDYEHDGGHDHEGATEEYEDPDGAENYYADHGAHDSGTAYDY